MSRIEEIWSPKIISLWEKKEMRAILEDRRAVS